MKQIVQSCNFSGFAENFPSRCSVNAPKYPWDFHKSTIADLQESTVDLAFRNSYTSLFGQNIVTICLRAAELGSFLRLKDSEV